MVKRKLKFFEGKCHTDEDQFTVIYGWYCLGKNRIIKSWNNPKDYANLQAGVR